MFVNVQNSICEKFIFICACKLVIMKFLIISIQEIQIYNQMNCINQQKLITIYVLSYIEKNIFFFEIYVKNVIDIRQIFANENKI